MAQTTVNFDMDENILRGMEQTCREMGFNITTVFTAFADKISRERIIPIEIADYNPKKAARERMREAFRLAQEDSVANGTDKMTMEEIINESSKSGRAAMFGCLRGKYVMAEDFDAPLDDMREYME